jgi:hypothetical protein
MSYNVEFFDFFKYFWANDKLACFKDEEDLRYVDELPDIIKIEIFKGFLFRSFINTFKNFFVIPKHIDQQHSYFKWTDEVYADFMISLMKFLEPRTYKVGQIIHEELSEVEECLFVLKGSYFVGYEINKIRKMRLHFPPGSIIGGFESTFNVQSMFIYKCKNEIHAYSIRKPNLKLLEDKNPSIFMTLKKRFFKNFMKQIRGPIMQYKNADLKAVKNRSENSMMLSLNCLSDTEMREIMKELWDDKSKEENKCTFDGLNGLVDNLEGAIYQILKSKESN